MEGKHLAQGLLNATGDDLRLVYALVMETKMLDLLVAKSKDLFNKELNHFERKLQEEIVRLRDYSDEELQLKLFFYLLEQLDIKGAYFNLPVEIETACEQIVLKTHELQKQQDKVYRSFAELREKDFFPSSILVMYQMQKIFESFDEERENMSDLEVEQFVDQIDTYIQSLPMEKKQQIQEKLHIDELTNKTIKQLIATQGTAIVMAIIVEVAGFTAFTTLTSAIAATVGIFGITLPFGAYMFATSALSILTGPVGLALMAVGGGYLLNKHNKKVRKTLLPIGVVQLLLPAMVQEEPIKYDDFIGLWSRLNERQLTYKSDIEKAIKKLEGLIEDKRVLEVELSELKAEIERIDEVCLKELAEIECQVDSIVQEDMSLTFTELSSRMANIRSSIEKLEAEQLQNASTSGFWKKVKGAVANTSLSNQVKKLEKEWLTLKDERLIEVVHLKPQNLVAHCDQVQACWDELKQRKEEKESLEERIRIKAENIRQAERNVKNARSALKDFQKVWYGFAHIE